MTDPLGGGESINGSQSHFVVIGTVHIWKHSALSHFLNPYSSILLASSVALSEDSAFQVPPKGAAVGSFPASKARFFHAGTSSSVGFE
mmetsp:Transcript_49670/g.98223  ORF Transcript_49670/g.98223 Transcript_49670/m.98223 type:complete len:88 (-) Transcript_49670:672-935(-)